MKQITINIQNWNRVDDKTILKVVKNAVDNLAKYGRENNGTNREYFTIIMGRKPTTLVVG